MAMKLIIFFTVILLFFKTEQLWAQNKPDCEMSEFENHLGSMIGKFGYKAIKWSENEQDMTTWCNTWPKDKPPVKQFTLQCLSGMSKTMGSVIVYASEKVNKLYCRNKKERQSYIAMGKCGNAAKKDTIKCWQGLTTLITNMQKLNTTDKIPTLCCSFFWWKGCTMGSFRKTPPGSCSEANIEHMEQNIDKASMDPLNLLCSDYDESDKCVKYNEKFDKTKVPIKYKTFFPALFQFFETL